ncbi:MAG: methyltransferase domain-containing protein [Wenzhouxiangellaceae bacterium]|nr:methyltransferase domain-containing protein [Wenzhouxiangellaceae bacterium]
MNAASRPVRSAQRGPHRRLRETVRRHLANPWRQPLLATARDAFAPVVRAAASGVPLWLDCGCGTGRSTAELARLHPARLVVGIDRSAHRLGRAPACLPENALLVRMRVEDAWRLAVEHALEVERTLLLYPNPWPKPGHLKRRWHAHPAFADLLAVGGEVELRTNWRVFAEEFRIALDVAGVADAEVVSFRPDAPLTPFEAKYLASGHVLHRLSISLESQR